MIARINELGLGNGAIIRLTSCRVGLLLNEY